ncbi:MAG TPA: hypothetical protein DEP23_13765 [Ruminococcaceae bacterium]|nr:hypothetical protein [Oscillospiraceae bacterium]
MPESLDAAAEGLENNEKTKVIRLLRVFYKALSRGSCRWLLELKNANDGYRLPNERKFLRE